MKEIKYIIYLIVFLIMTSITGCEEKTGWDIANTPAPLLVVEGLVTNERKQQEVRLSQTVSDINQPPAPVSGAFVGISDGSKFYRLEESETDKGLYITLDTLQGVINRSYILSIRYRQQEYYATAQMLPVSPLNELQYQRINEEENWYSLTEQYSIEPSMTKILLDWTHLPGYEMYPDEEKKSLQYFYTLRSVDVVEFFKPEKEVVQFPSGTKIIRKKYSLSPKHEKYIRSMLAETEWRGWIFDVTPGNIYTNLSEGAIGFFGASTVTMDSLVFSP